jgi:ribosomal protein S18 acetylase RimI-like enzyme
VSAPAAGATTGQAVATWQRLEWDSGFFGFGIGRLAAMPRDAAELADTMAQARSAGIRLLYAACPQAAKASRALLEREGAVFVDAKRTYAASPIPAFGAPTVCIQAVASPLHPVARRQLRALAWQAAEYSRFRIDARMPPGAWRLLYSAWIANSLDGRIADRVLVVRAGPDAANLGSCIGMVTLAHRGTQASIGLLAVHAGHRGRGLGRALVMAAATDARQAGCIRLSVVTHGSNAAACRTYESCGLALADEQLIFHLWTQP